MALSKSNTLYNLSNSAFVTKATSSTEYHEADGDLPPVLRHLPGPSDNADIERTSVLGKTDLERLRSNAAPLLTDHGVMDQLFEAVYRALPDGALSHCIQSTASWKEEQIFGARLLELSLIFEQTLGWLNGNHAAGAVQTYRDEWEESETNACQLIEDEWQRLIKASRAYTESCGANFSQLTIEAREKGEETAMTRLRDHFLSLTKINYTQEVLASSGIIDEAEHRGFEEDVQNSHQSDRETGMTPHTSGSWFTLAGMSMTTVAGLSAGVAIASYIAYTLMSHNEDE